MLRTPLPFRSIRAMGIAVAPLPHPALHASHSGIWIADADGTRPIGRGEAIRIAADTPVIVLNAPLIGQRLGYADLSGLDVLELFAFLRPARFMVPTPRGLARETGLDAPATDAEIAAFLRSAAEKLLDMTKADWPEREGPGTAHHFARPRGDSGTAGAPDRQWRGAAAGPARLCSGSDGGVRPAHGA
jgi:hypothetical protein